MFDKFSIKISQNTKNAIVFIYKVKTEVYSECKIDKKFAMLGKSMYVISYGLVWQQFLTNFTLSG